MSNIEAAEAPVEEIVPSPDNSGDWGEGTLELEQQLLEKTQGTDDSVEPEVAAEPAPEAPVVQEPVVNAEPVPLFDINGKLSIEAGKPLTAEHIKELERGWLREKDYTQKTQQVAEMRDAAQYVLDAQKKIQENPQTLREYFDDKQILSAFKREEMLNYGLAAAGVPVQAWNQFLQWYKEAGYNEGQQPLPTADPYVQQFGALNKQIQTLGKSLEQLQFEKQQQAELQVKAQQEAAYNAEMSRIDGEVQAALKNFPDVEKEDLLVEMARSDGTRSVAELAKAVHDRYEGRFNKWIENKKQIKATAVKPAKGQSVNIVQRPPKTFAEADDLIDSVYGTGSLKPR